jgi:peptidoglycan biosynthesis protein MviN/MurJ (putative lipid II flippase)
MDNGWKILSPEEEARYQKRMQIALKLICFVGVPAYFILFMWGLFHAILNP